MLKNITILFVLLTLANLSLAESGIYTWTDKDGITHYTSKPTKNAKKAKLPEINKGDVKLPVGTLISCSEHGGINCQVGPDEDGSVICYDGFTEASPRFRFSCLSPRLKITNISEIKEDGSFTVTVRNEKSVIANDPVVIYRQKSSGQEHQLTGPKEVSAYGVSDFTFFAKDADIPLSKADLSELTIKCSNCS